MPESSTSYNTEFSSYNEEREGAHIKQRHNNTIIIDEVKMNGEDKNETIHRKEHNEGIDEQEVEIYHSNFNRTVIQQVPLNNFVEIDSIEGIAVTTTSNSIDEVTQIDNGPVVDSNVLSINDQTNGTFH